MWGKNEILSMPLKFSHTLTEQIGGLIKAGFQIADIMGTAMVEVCLINT